MVGMLSQKFAKLDGSYHRDIMFFINHPFCDYYFGHEFDGQVYEMEAELYDKTLRKDNETYTKVFYAHIQKLLDSGCRLASMNYDPDILAPLGRLGMDYQRECRDIYQFFAFFHNDEETKLLYSADPQENLLELKEAWRSCLASFPFVNIIEISLGGVVDIQLADRLYRNYPPATESQ
jgi:hypothetical protein